MILGVDMGGTHTRIGLVDESLLTGMKPENDRFALEGLLEKPCRVYPSKLLALTEDPAFDLWQVILAYLQDVGERNEKIDMISIGTPASVCADLETIYCAPNLSRDDGRLVFENYNLSAELKKYCSCPVLVNKDVNNLLCYDLLDHHLGDSTVVACYIGTGVGGAVSIRGEIMLGDNGFAMDIGHMPLFHGTKRCGCGKTGCVETEVSGSFLRKMAAAAYPGESLSGLFERHKEERLVQGYVENCALVPAILATVFDPSAIVLGGGVMEASDFPKELLEKEILRQTGRAVASAAPRFVYADCLPERGVIGAALFAMRTMRG